MAKGGVKLKVTGLDDVLTRLDTLSNKTSFYKTAVYSGAGVVADEMKRQIKSLKTTSEKGKRTDKRYIYPYVQISIKSLCKKASPPDKVTLIPPSSANSSNILLTFARGMSKPLFFFPLGI